MSTPLIIMVLYKHDHENLESQMFLRILSLSLIFFCRLKTNNQSIDKIGLGELMIINRIREANLVKLMADQLSLLVDAHINVRTEDEA